MKTNRQTGPYLNLSILGTVVAVVLLVQTTFLVALWLENRSINNRLSTLFTAVHQQPSGDFNPFEVQPVADAANKRLYLPGLALYLPLTIDAMDLTYRVTDASGGGTTDLVFMSKLNNRLATDRSRASDGCLDLVRVEVGAKQSQPRNNESAQEPFKLDDGRMVYTYLPKSNAECQDFIPVASMRIEPIIRQLRSY